MYQRHQPYVSRRVTSSARIASSARASCLRRAHCVAWSCSLHNLELQLHRRSAGGAAPLLPSDQAPRILGGAQRRVARPAHEVLRPWALPELASCASSGRAFAALGGSPLPERRSGPLGSAATASGCSAARASRLPKAADSQAPADPSAAWSTRWNPFHATEDLFNAFLVLLVHNVSAADLQVIVADRKQEGALYPLWQRAFSPNHALTRLEDWRGSSPSVDSTVCFDRLLLQMPHAACKVCNPIASPTRCGRSPVLSLYADFVLRGFGLPPVTSAPPGGGGCRDPVRVTWITRKRRKAGTSQSAFQKARTLDPAFEAAVLRAIPSNTSLGPPIVARLVDFAALDVAAQLATARATSVLVGMHGAGLTHLVMMAPGSAVLEMNAGANYHYVNFAARAGHTHAAVSHARLSAEIVRAAERVVRARCSGVEQKEPAPGVGLSQSRRQGRGKGRGMRCKFRRGK